MLLAGKSANGKHIPVVLDVCGAGATKFRDDKCFEILDAVRVSIIKGNSSEIARIAGENVQTKGVDAVIVEKNLQDVARELAKKRNCTVVITAKRTLWPMKEFGAGVERPLHDGRYRRHGVHGNIGDRDICRSRNGSGCRFCRRSCMLRGCREIAAKNASGPVSFKEKLIDACTTLIPAP